MAYGREYGELEKRMIELFQAKKPDFTEAEELIRQGADINLEGSDDENVLSEILGGYWMSWLEEEAAVSDKDFSWEKYHENPDRGACMCEIIRFFLAHGFDVKKNDGRQGAQCLYALVLSTFDRYMIEATKLLLDAGARNGPVTTEPESRDETPWNAAGFEQSIQGSFYGNYHLENVFEALWQIYQANEDGRPYAGIDSYQAAIGKVIRRVLAEKDDTFSAWISQPVSDVWEKMPYTKRLFFVYDEGALVVNEHENYWVDTVLPDCDLEDVSDQFESIVGNKAELLLTRLQERQKVIQEDPNLLMYYDISLSRV